MIILFARLFCTMSSDLCIITWWLLNIQAQKELLDAELDLYKKSQSGEDTAMLKLQYTQLQIEVTFSHTSRTLQMTPKLCFNNRKSGNLSSNSNLHSCLCVSTQAAKRGILAPGRGRGLFSRGRGTVRGRGSRGRGRGVPLHAVVDHRPRALEISGFADSDRVDLLPHFAVSQSSCVT